jgi:hypothetical protein
MSPHPGNSSPEDTSLSEEHACWMHREPSPNQLPRPPPLMTKEILAHALARKCLHQRKGLRHRGHVRWQVLNATGGDSFCSPIGKPFKSSVVFSTTLVERLAPPNRLDVQPSLFGLRYRCSPRPSRIPNSVSIPSDL